MSRATADVDLVMRSISCFTLCLLAVGFVFSPPILHYADAQDAPGAARERPRLNPDEPKLSDSLKKDVKFPAQRTSETNIGSVKLIPASYYAQFGSGWCWAATTSMLVTSQSYDVHPQAVGAAFRKTVSEGAHFTWWFPLGYVNLNDQLKKKQLIPDRLTVTQTDSTVGNAWMQRALDENKPVWVGLRYKSNDGHSEHAVLVVGYDKKGFYVHDPSGSLLDFVSRNTSRQFGERQRAFAFIPYEVWNNILVLSLAFIDSPVTDTSKTITIQAGPAVDSELTFHRRHLVSPGRTLVNVMWNGLLDAGCGFSSSDVRDEELFGSTGLCNSDYMDKAGLYVHNTSDKDVETQIHFEIDRRQVGPAISVTSPARTTNFLVDAFDPRHGSKAQQLAAAFDFAKNPLSVGKHELKIAISANGKTLDSFLIPFDMRPAIVPEMEVTRKQFEQDVFGDTFEWTASADEQRLGRGNYHYNVYYVETFNGKLQKKLIKTVTEPGVHRAGWKFLVPAEKPESYQIAIVDKTTGLESPLSQFFFPNNSVLYDLSIVTTQQNGTEKKNPFPIYRLRWTESRRREVQASLVPAQAFSEEDLAQLKQIGLSKIMPLSVKYDDGKYLITGKPLEQLAKLAAVAGYVAGEALGNVGLGALLQDTNQPNDSPAFVVNKAEATLTKKDDDVKLDFQIDISVRLPGKQAENFSNGIQLEGSQHR